MKILVEDIPDTGLSVDVKEEGSTLAGLAGELDFEMPAPVKGHLVLTKSDGGVYVSGNINATLGLTCGRCLKVFEKALDIPVSIFYTCYAEKEKEKELSPADMEVNHLPGGELDTAEVLLSQVSLEAPMKPLCDPGCKGLCPRCGADLNQGACRCKTEDKIDPRLAALKAFKLK